MITVFIATYNRLDTLERTVKSFRRFTTPYELIIVDNGTDHPKCIEMLETIGGLEEVTRVYSLGRVRSMNGLTRNFNRAIRDYRRSLANKDHRWFAVSDADICFEGTSRKALDAYVSLARHTGFSVGPHTRVDKGIPHGYPLRSRVLATESRLLYRNSMKWHRQTPYSAWQIDTTFHVFPASRRFDRLHMNTVRCGPPYDAMHLDWYVDATRPAEENWIYLAKRKSGVGSWGSNWLSGYWKAFQRDRAQAFRELLAEPRSAHDLCNVSFMLSWAYQHGHTETGQPDIAASLRELARAVPRDTVWHRNRFDYARMIYMDDFQALGWAST